METSPMPLDSLAGLNAGLDEFRVASPREIGNLLKQLCDGSVLLNLNASDGSVFTSTIWTMDAARATIGFSAEIADTGMQALLECDEVVVVGYLNNVKLQFDVHNLVLVHGTRASVLSCAFPREMFRFQRRNSFRVRPPIRNDPQARLLHTEIADLELALRVLDVSIGGCALLLPDNVPPMRPGVLLQRVLIELDADTRFHVNLRLRHVTSINATATGVRLGCEFVQAGGDALRALQRFIDLTQKRGRLLALD